MFDRPIARRHSYLVSLLGLALVLSVGAARAEKGHYIEQHQTQSGMMGQPATSSSQKLWIGTDKFRVEDEASKMVTLMLAKQGEFFMINNAEKTYTQLTMEQISQMAEMGLAMLKELSPGAEPTVEVRETGEKKRVGEWDARGVVVEMGGMMAGEVKLWLADLPIDMRSWATLTEQSMPGIGAEMARKMAALKGYPVLQETTLSMMGMTLKTTTEVRVVRPVELDPALFVPPADFTKVEGPMGMPGRPPG